MRRLAALLIHLLGAAPALAFQAVPAQGGGRVVADTVHAPSLAGNLLGDPTEQPVWVYVPPGYDADAGRRYPTLYLLHGVLDDPSVWYEPVYQGMTIQATMDSLIGARTIGPMIVVMPNGRNALGGSYYRNSPATGNWADYIARDLVAHVDRTYRTIAAVEARAIAGHSMGGLGAVWMGMLHPDVFSVVYGMNPCCLCCLEEEGDVEDPISLEEYDSVDALWERLEDRGDFWPLIVAGASAALSPNPDRPPFFGDPPYHVEGGRVVADSAVLGRWQAAYPVAEVARRAEGLRRLRGLAFDSAFDDQFVHIPPSTAAFSDSLTANEVPHSYEVYAGDHRNRMRERMVTRVLPWISARLGDGPPASPPERERSP